MPHTLNSLLCHPFVGGVYVLYMLVATATSLFMLLLQSDSSVIVTVMSSLSTSQLQLHVHCNTTFLDELGLFGCPHFFPSFVPEALSIVDDTFSNHTTNIIRH